MSRDFYFRNLLMIQMITAMTRITRKIPTLMPALKISPIASHEAKPSRTNSSSIVL